MSHACQCSQVTHSLRHLVVPWLFSLVIFLLCLFNRIMAFIPVVGVVGYHEVMHFLSKPSLGQPGHHYRLTCCCSHHWHELSLRSCLQARWGSYCCTLVVSL